MCSVSMVADDWRKNVIPGIVPYPYVPHTPNGMPGGTVVFTPPVTRAEFEALRVELEAVKKQLLEAKKQDEADGNPDCEMEEKIDIFRQLGKMVGIDFDEVFNVKS